VEPAELRRAVFVHASQVRRELPLDAPFDRIAGLARAAVERDTTPAIAYAGQFEPAPDPLHIAIPREEIVLEMATRGESATLDRVCLSVAVVLDAIASAQEDARA